MFNIFCHRTLQLTNNILNLSLPTGLGMNFINNAMKKKKTCLYVMLLSCVNHQIELKKAFKPKSYLLFILSDLQGFVGCIFKAATVSCFNLFNLSYK